MRKTWRLVVNYFLNFVGSFISKKRNARFAFGLLFVLGIGALFIFIFTNTAIQTSLQFKQIGAPELAMYLNASMALLILLFLTVMRSALPAKTTDEQLLLSLPLKKTQIILAKTLYNYLFDFLSLIGILFPSFVVYAVINGAGVLIVLRGLLVIALLPLLSNALATIIALIFQKISTSFRNYSIVQTILILVLIGVYIVSSYVFNDYLTKNASNPEVVLNQFKPMKWILVYILDGTFIYLLWIALMTIGAFIIGIFFKVRAFGKEIKTYRSNKTDLVFTERSPLVSLYLKELRYYFSVPIYVINTIFGVIMYIGLAIALLIVDPNMLNQIIVSIGGTVNGVEVVFCLAAACLIITTVCTTSSAISLEGKHLWILKAHPVKTRDVFLAKILVNLTLTTIPVVIMAPVISIKLGITTLWMFILIPFLASLVIAILGLYINLLFPKMEWESEVVPVKQSMSVMLALLFGFVFALLPFVLYFVFLINIINYVLFSLLLVVYFVLFALLSYVLLMKNGKRQFDSL